MMLYRQIRINERHNKLVINKTQITAEQIT